MNQHELMALQKRLTSDLSKFASHIKTEMNKYANTVDTDNAKAVKKALKESKFNGVFKQLEAEERDLRNKLKHFKQ